MAYIATGETITEAWVASLDHLHAHGGEEFDLIVEIANSTPSRADPIVVRHVDGVLSAQGCHLVDTVANTIFPVGLAASSPDRVTLYRRYRALLPRLHRLRGNHKGTYFERLITYPLQTDPARANQIETIIGDLSAQLARRALRQGPLGSIYEGQVFVPGKDRVPMGFPCMSSLSFQLDGTRLRLTATYRNQYYIQRALGNFLGLAHLQRFVCDAVGLDQGPVTVHAFHAEVDLLGKRATAALLESCHAASADLRPRHDDSAAAPQSHGQRNGRRSPCHEGTGTVRVMGTAI